MKVAVLGGNGQLGVDTCAAYGAQGHSVSALNHQDIEISNIDSVISVLGSLRPDIVINTAAMHHVDRCEEDVQKAFLINAVGARNLAIASNEVNFTLAHVSTDYVFDGRKAEPYSESDSPAPLNAYGNSKLAGELFVRSIAKRYFIFRTSALFGTSPCRAKGQNFVELMLRLGRERDEVRVVDSEVLSPTWTLDLARQMVPVSATEHFGLYHASAEGSCSWHQFAHRIFSLTRCNTKLSVASPNEFPAKVPRPAYSVLENAALKSSGWNTLKSWQDGLSEYLAHRR
jgi:dTDP-4-dehydrorhamnose reductase